MLPISPDCDVTTFPMFLLVVGGVVNVLDGPTGGRVEGYGVLGMIVLKELFGCLLVG